MSTVSTDPIADMLSRIRNAIAVRKTTVSMPHSKAKESVAKLLVDNKMLSSVKLEKAEVGKTLTIVINSENDSPRITEIKRMSTPGRRMYSKSTMIPQVKRGRGIVIVSTSHGMLTGDEAKRKGIGGELICQVY